MNEILKNHYEEKYKNDKDASDIPGIPYVKYPSNRFTACVKYFTDHFKSGDILELGAGKGIIAKSLLMANPDINHYMASDLSENRLRAISNNLQDDRLEVSRIDADNFDPSSMQKYDAVIMIALIEHLIDPIQALNKIRKVLKPGGFVYIDTPNIADYGARYKLLNGKFPSTASKDEGLTTYDNAGVSLFDEGHLHYFTYRSLSVMLKKYSGFSETEKYFYPVGKFYLGKAIHYKLARIKPELFSMLVMIAR